MNRTFVKARIFKAMLEDPARPRYGLEMLRELGLFSGTIYPVLRQLETEGLVTSWLEQIDPHEQERPRRRYYRLTPAGEEHARAELAALMDMFRLPADTGG